MGRTRDAHRTNPHPEDQMGEITKRGFSIGAAILTTTWAGTASGGTATEYFNDYGTQVRSLAGLNGGAGWTSPWTGGGASYTPGFHLLYAGVGYSNAGNQSDANDGAAFNGLAFRTLPALTGTVWISATEGHGGSATVLLLLDKTDSTSTELEFVGLSASSDVSPPGSQVPEPLISYGGVRDGSDDTDLRQEFVHLMLLRIDMNVGGGSADEIRYWVNPDLSACREVVEEMRAAYPARTVRCQARGEVSGEWDAARLRQVVSNLLGNAIQHGASDGPVDLSLRAEGSEVVLAVHNGGAPIPPDALATIFDPLVRGSSPELQRQRRPGSIGLGLYIAREVVTGHGGVIDVKSSEQAGTVFTVRLPRRRPPAAAAGPGPSRESS
jgi:hypothetical protein